MSRMPWHETPDDYEESPYVDDDIYVNNFGEEHAYYERTQNHYDWIKKPVITYAPGTTIDDDIRRMEEEYRNPQGIPEIFTRPVDQPEHVTFRYQWKTTSTTQTTRNRLRTGNLQTLSQKLLVWGFDSWTECKAHVHPSDKKSLYYHRDELVADLALSHREFELTYWIAKGTEPESLTRPSWWAITIDYPADNERFVFTSWNDRQVCSPQLKIKFANSITYNWGIV